MKNLNYITYWILAVWLVFIASETFASYSSWQWLLQGLWMNRGIHMSQAGVTAKWANFLQYGSNIDRSVKNTETWVEVTLTSKDSTTLAHIKDMLKQNSIKTQINQNISITRTELADGIKITATSSDKDTVKLIQDRATNAKSWLFGQWWEVKWRGMWMGMGKWSGKWQGRGMWMGRSWSNCTMN